LADAIVAQPLALRVIVNRIWKQHFGTGIVDTPSNFGVTGERPTNPELLDYLAGIFARDGMSLKKLHREIMLSAVYQLSTELDQHDYEKDSGNRYYWRASRRRLDAEQVRDSILTAAGNLDDSLGGPSVELSPSFTRRTVYGKVSRYKLDEYLQLFDFPSPNISAEKRFSTTVPLQRLFLMNSDFMQIEAEQLVKRVATEPDNASRIKKLYRIVYNREPSEQELKLAIDYLHSEPMREFEEAKNKPPDKAAEAGQPAEPEDAATATDGDVPAPTGDGMMAGVPGYDRRGPQKAAAPAPKYVATPWGRYAKILLSSSEFLYID
jgi:hypothetical protein